MNEELEVNNTENKVLAENEVTAEVQTDSDIKNELLHKEVIKTEEAEPSFDANTFINKTLEELIEEAKTVLILTPKAASDKLKAIKAVFIEKYRVEKDEAKAKYDESKTDESEDFSFIKKGLTEDIKEVELKVKQAREEEKERIEQEKKNNLAKKEALLDKLQDLVAQDETLDSINLVKDIQREWKTIRVLPKDSVTALWDRYNLLQNKFYDNHSINIELKELDRQKNLEAKIELTKKVDELHQEKSLKRSFILLNKFHEEFKNIGPVPQESREPIWQAFKTASDSVYDAKRKVYEEYEVVKEANLKLKEVLVEKANLLNLIKPEALKGWNEKTKGFEGLFEEWKAVGPVPKSNKDAAWIQFNGTRNDFYTARKEYFKELNAGRNDNLKAKELLCERVEKLKDSTDWAKSSNEIITIQAEWKTIGPVPEKVNQSIWKKFRGHCDHFFNAKNQAFAGKREEETENLTKKEELISALTALAGTETSHKDAFKELKRINAEWRAVGYVPHKAVKRVSKAYEEANNAVYEKYSSQIEEAKAANLSEHYKEMNSSHNGQKALEDEERNIKRRMTTFNEEIGSIERNMSFFAQSKTADKMLKDFEQKIVRLRTQIDKLKKELSAIKNAKREAKQEAEANSASTDEVASAE